MRVAAALQKREAVWSELDQLVRRVEHPGQFIRTRADQPGRRGPLLAAEILRLGELYRAACSDIMIAEEQDWPRQTVEALHALVGRAHNAVYRAERFKLSTWAGAIARELPVQLRSDGCLLLAALVFFGGMLLTGLASAARPEFARLILPQAQLQEVEAMYAEPLQSRSGSRDDPLMTGFYIQHNASIGLQSYVWGALTLGVGAIVVLLGNAVTLGAIFGHMTRTAHAGNFYEFVTAHGPFELTAIVLAGSAGLLVGRGFFRAGDLPRLASLQRAAVRSLPRVALAVVLFIFAAFIEGFVSASALPYAVKAGVAILSSFIMLSYLLLPGRAGRLHPGAGWRRARGGVELAGGR